MSVRGPNKSGLADLAAEEGNVAILDVVRRRLCKVRMRHNLSTRVLTGYEITPVTHSEPLELCFDRLARADTHDNGNEHSVAHTPLLLAAQRSPWLACMS